MNMRLPIWNLEHRCSEFSAWSSLFSVSSFPTCFFLSYTCLRGCFAQALVVSLSQQHWTTSFNTRQHRWCRPSFLKWNEIEQMKIGVAQRKTKQSRVVVPFPLFGGASVLSLSFGPCRLSFSLVWCCFSPLGWCCLLFLSAFLCSFSRVVVINAITFYHFNKTGTNTWENNFTQGEGEHLKGRGGESTTTQNKGWEGSSTHEGKSSSKPTKGWDRSTTQRNTTQQEEMWPPLYFGSLLL